MHFSKSSRCCSVYSNSEIFQNLKTYQNSKNYFKLNFQNLNVSGTWNLFRMRELKIQEPSELDSKSCSKLKLYSEFYFLDSKNSRNFIQELEEFKTFNFNSNSGLKLFRNKRKPLKIQEPSELKLLF